MENKMNNRKGSVYFSILVGACLVSGFTIISAFYLSHIKPTKIANSLFLISTDYQTESYVTLQLSKYKNNEKSIDSYEKEIISGIYMNSKSCKINSDEYLFEISCVGKGIDRKIKVKGSSSNPNKLIYLD